MSLQQFRTDLLAYLAELRHPESTNLAPGSLSGRPTLGAYAGLVYTVGVDAGLAGQMAAFTFLPLLLRFAYDRQYKVILPASGFPCPDVTLLAPDETKIAVDIAVTERADREHIRPFRLGSFVGHFRDRSIRRVTLFPYGEYSAHFLLGLVYTPRPVTAGHDTCPLHSLETLAAVLDDFVFVIDEKWRLASDVPGQGLASDIVSIGDLARLQRGEGPFVPYGPAVYEDYWLNYLTDPVAAALETQVPYRSIECYRTWRAATQVAEVAPS